MMIYLLLIHTSDQSVTKGINSSSPCQVLPCVRLLDNLKKLGTWTIFIPDAFVALKIIAVFYNVE